MLAVAYSSLPIVKLLLQKGNTVESRNCDRISMVVIRWDSTDHPYSIHIGVLAECFLAVDSQPREGCREQPPRGAPWVSGLVGHFVQTCPDSECSHKVQCLDCSHLN